MLKSKMSTRDQFNPTQRFSSRVSDYVKYRPGYPPQVVGWLSARCGLTPASVIADVGSGTGLLTKLFLDNGNRVYGVEPNTEMRLAGEHFLAACPNFISTNGAAEHTTLPSSSVDFVTAGQAFHWFDGAKASAEFRRILKPNGWVALIWNDRDTTSTPFLREYEKMLQTYSPDYGAVDHKNTDVNTLGIPLERKDFANAQMFDFAALKGRLMSSSYAPQEGHPQHVPMLTELRHIFDAHNQNGVVGFKYTTQVFVGQA
jgi:SAM-dependent methyltransferase